MYSIEKLYHLVCMQQHAVGVFFRFGSPSYRQYGESVTIVDFNVVDKEREMLVGRVIAGNNTQGIISVRILTGIGVNSQYKDATINTNDIEEIEMIS